MEQRTCTDTLACLEHGNKNVLIVQVKRSRVANMKERNPFEDLGVDGNNIKMDIEGTGLRIRRDSPHSN